MPRTHNINVAIKLDVGDNLLSLYRDEFQWISRGYEKVFAFAKPYVERILNEELGPDSPNVKEGPKGGVSYYWSGLEAPNPPEAPNPDAPGKASDLFPEPLPLTEERIRQMEAAVNERPDPAPYVKPPRAKTP